MEQLNIIAKELGYIIWKDQSSCPDYRGYLIFTLENFNKPHCGRCEDAFPNLKDCAKFLARKMNAA